MMSYILKYTIEDMKELAAQRGGRCLSKKYLKSFTKLTWQCEKGHVWDAPPVYIKSGWWCRACSRIRRKLTIEEMYKIAQSRGGQCLSDKYILSNSKLKWQCSEGHTWEATPGQIRAGRWCPYCGKNKTLLTMSLMHQLAKKRKGKCLSHNVKNVKNKLKWQCDQGHVWQANPVSIKSGRWCPVCRGTAKLKEMYQIAKSRGGKCLSVKYVNSLTKLKWKCKEGHIWEALPFSVKYKSWCLLCVNRRKKKTKR